MPKAGLSADHKAFIEKHAQDYTAQEIAVRLDVDVAQVRNYTANNKVKLKYADGRKKLEDWQKDFIRENSKGLTVAEMSEKTGLNTQQVSSFVHNYNLPFRKMRGEKMLSTREEEDEESKKKIVRPPAVYGNIPSPYGITTAFLFGESDFSKYGSTDSKSHAAKSHGSFQKELNPRQPRR